MKITNLRYNLLLILFIFNIIKSNAQGVGINTTTPHLSSILDVNATSFKGGILLPRVSLLGTNDITTIENPAVGLIVFNLDNSGISPANVEALRYYSWNGTQWIDLSDIELVRRILVPQVFCSQTNNSQGILGADLTSLNSGNDVLVTFPSTSIVINNGNHITLQNDIFTINTTGTYEISGYICYVPRVTGQNFDPLSTSITNLEYKIQKSINNGPWLTVGRTTGVWGRNTGQWVRSVIVSPMLLNVTKNDKLRAIITKTFGADHGNGIGTVAIQSGVGMPFSKNLRIQKLK